MASPGLRGRRAGASSWSASRWWRCCSSGRCSYPFRAALTVGVALAQIGEFSFILATLGRELGHPHDRGDQRARRDLDRVDRAQSDRVPDDPAARALGSREAAALGAAEPRIARSPSDLQAPRVEHARRSRPSRRGHRLWPDRPDRRAAAARQRHRADGGRAEHGRRPRASGGRHRCHLRRCDPSRDARGGGRRPGRQPHSRLRRHGEQRRSDSRGSRAEPARSRPGAGPVPARCRRR